MAEWFTQDDLKRALAMPGVNQARLARALGVEPPRVSEWKHGVIENQSRTRADLAAAVLVAQGKSAPAMPSGEAVEPLLVALEQDARRMLERIAQARAATRLPAARGTEALAALDAARESQAAGATGRRSRRAGGR